MTAGQKPWDGVIPAEDIDSFNQPELHYRSMSAGMRPAVIVVDMTREFVYSEYPSAFSDTALPAAAAIATLLEVARSADLPIFYTKTFADPAYSARPAERGRWKMATGTGGPTRPDGLAPGDVIVDELAPQPDDIVFHKGFQPSGFHSTRLGPCMVQADRDTAIVAGISTSGCVRATLLDAFQFGFHCVVPFECVADRSQLSHKVNLFDMHMKYADVVSLDETIEYIEKLP